MALIGVAGAGKTYTALSIAHSISARKVAVVDTERGSASKYSDLFEFDVMEMEILRPQDCMSMPSRPPKKPVTTC